MLQRVALNVVTAGRAQAKPVAAAVVQAVAGAGRGAASAAAPAALAARAPAQAPMAALRTNLLRTGKDFVEEAATDAFSNATGVQANTSPSFGGALYQTGKLALAAPPAGTPGASPQHAAAAPAAAAPAALGGATPHAGAAAHFLSGNPTSAAMQAFVASANDAVKNGG
jgi:hypothetical protein